MANAQRTKNDWVTTGRREIADEIRRDNRDKNDALTKERRQKVDRIVDEKRLRNDEMTAERRKRNDRNPWRTFVISLLVLSVLAIGAYYLYFYIFT